MQFTVKDVVNLLKDARQINFAFNGNIVATYGGSEPERVVLEAWSDFIVDSLCSTGDDVYEVAIACIPLKKGGCVQYGSQG